MYFENRSLVVKYNIIWPKVKCHIWSTIFRYQNHNESYFKCLDIQSWFWSILRYLRTLHIVWSLVRRRVTRRLARLQTMYNVLYIAKHYEIMTKVQFTGTATQPHRKRKFRQFILTSTVWRYLYVYINLNAFISYIRDLLSDMTTTHIFNR